MSLSAERAGNGTMYGWYLLLFSFFFSKSCAVVGRDTMVVLLVFDRGGEVKERKECMKGDFKEIERRKEVRKEARKGKEGKK